jgi:hypothetical protein
MADTGAITFTWACTLRYKVDMTDAAQVLTEVDQLRQRVRTRAHGGAWFPALAIGVFLLLSIALYSQPFNQPGHISVDVPYWAGLPDEQRNPIVSYLFWFLGTPLLLGIITRWYHRRERELGLRVRWPLFAVVAVGTLVLIGLLAAIPKEPAGDPNPLVPLEFQAGDMATALLTPLIAVALALVVLGSVEKTRWLAFTGIWIGVITWWQGAFLAYGIMGGTPGWLASLLSGGEGPALGGQFALLSLNRPGPLLILMALPLFIFAAARARRGARV